MPSLHPGLSAGLCGGAHAAHPAGAQPDGEPHRVHGRHWGEVGGGEAEVIHLKACIL